jgi:hypothetical protein
MRMQEFFEHHGLATNPFADEDAQSDPIFKQVMSTAVFHPSWDKIYGRPEEAGTAIVFGEKGSGKTALRLQIYEHIEKHNRENPEARVFVIQYEDFNQFLDRFNESKGGTGRGVLKMWSLWDHIDSILSLGVTMLVDRLVSIGRMGPDDSLSIDTRRAARISPLMKRDLLMLAAFYDRARTAPFLDRWKKVASRLRYGTMIARWADALGWAGSAIVAFLVARQLWSDYTVLGKWWFWLVMGILLGGSWVVKLRRMLRIGSLSSKVAKDVAVVPRHPKELRIALSHMRDSAIQDQPLPVTGPADARYQLLSKFTAILREFGFRGTVVLMDRIDEPQLINGSPDAMRSFVWPLLDNKLLKHPGIGFKLLLPIELSHYLPKESKDFYERSRLDKQNTVRSLEWSGQALYDMAGERLTASLPAEKQKAKERLSLRSLIDEELKTSEIVNSIDHLRVPRHLFKFLYRLITEHCNTYTSDEPEWQIKATTFQSVLKLYLRDLEAFDKGYGHG